MESGCGFGEDKHHSREVIQNSPGNDIVGRHFCRSDNECGSRPLSEGELQDIDHKVQARIWVGYHESNMVQVLLNRGRLNSRIPLLAFWIFCMVQHVEDLQRNCQCDQHPSCGMQGAVWIVCLWRERMKKVWGKLGHWLVDIEWHPSLSFAECIWSLRHVSGCHSSSRTWWDSWQASQMMEDQKEGWIM